MSKIFLVTDVDREDLWVNGFAMTIPEEIVTIKEALAIPEVKKAIEEYDWKDFFSVEEVLELEVGDHGVDITVMEDDETREEHLTYNFMPLLGIW